MKRSSSNRYSGISSFKDFRREKEILTLRSKLIDAKFSLTFLQMKQNLSPSHLILSLAKEYILPGVARFLGYSRPLPDA